MRDDTCHMWLIHLLSPELQAEPILSAAEKKRAQQFKFDQHRIRFIAAHVALRRILASALGIETPKVLKYAEHEHGKPYLKDYPNLHFNLSHSGDYALVGVAEQAIGVDIEQQADRDEIALAKRFFSRDECQWIAAKPKAEQQKAFFTLWTRKEAVIKLTGLGLQMGLDTFSTIPQAEGALPLPSSSPTPYAIQAIGPLPAGYQAALASYQALSTKMYCMGDQCARNW